ncbi:MAG: glycosyltransferase family 39 protein, partial [Acidobacteriaceae bacterium]|nr:glycosyltransferase family 39 protein [Acidobacteriaceae bacterium]
IAALILLCTHGFFYQARLGTTDMMLTLWMTVSVYGIYRVSKRDQQGWYLFWIGLALAIMTKSAAPAPVVITLAIVAVTQKWKSGWFGQPFEMGSFLFLLLVVPWHAYMLVTFGKSFFDDYIGRQLLARSVEPLEGHVGGPLFYIVHIAKSAFPWSLVLIGPAIRFRSERRLSVPGIYAAVVLCFYTLIVTKLTWYITPIYPALSIVIAHEMAHWMRPRITLFVAPVAVSTFLAVFLWTDLRRPYERPEILLIKKHRNDMPGTLLILCSDRFLLDMPAALFYGDKPTVQAYLDDKPDRVEGLGAVDPASNDYKFRNPQPLSHFARTSPELILLHRALSAKIATRFEYHAIDADQEFELGTIQARQ